MKAIGHIVALLVLGAGVAGSTMAAPGAAPSMNGRIAFTSNWAENLAAEIFKVEVATGRRTNLTKNPAYDGGAVVSPDGKTVLFRSSRDNFRAIWRMNADGSGQRALVAGELPAWSPDGTRIVFVDERQHVASMAADGSDVRRLFPGNFPAWSPDGKSIGYLDGSSLKVAGADGIGARRIYETTRISPSVSWSPDSRWVLVSAEVLLESGLVSPAAIVVVPAAGGEPRVLTKRNTDRDPHWARDGSRIAFVRAGRIFTVPATGGAAVAITRPPAGAYDGRPTWSPDGRFLAFARGHGEDQFRELWVVPARGGTARRVRREDVHASFASQERPAWSGDGRSLLYSQALDGDRDLYTVEPDGSGLRQLTKNDVDDYDPSFSPDGRSIAFVRVLRASRESYNQELFVMRADGSGVRRLTRWSGEDLAPAWSPDGSRIVFVRRTPGAGDDALLSLYTIRPDGAHLVKLKTADEFWDSPTWSPDSRSIAVTSGNGIEEGGDLSVVRADGSRGRQLLHLGEEEVAHHPAWSPSGNRISFVRATVCNVCDGGDLWTVAPSGERPRLLVGGVADAAWSPDGARLVTLGFYGQPLRIVSADGKLVRDLKAVRGAGSPGLSWQPRCTITGGPRADRLGGSAGSDLVCGLGGDDRITGGTGRDRLLGGDGDDAIDARDRGFDVVGCGSGRDTVRADRVDLVGVDCELVSRP